MLVASLLMTASLILAILDGSGFLQTIKEGAHRKDKCRETREATGYPGIDAGLWGLGAPRLSHPRALPR